jgi:colanic acid/amylovoran biosynthesis glycosyltransferase
LQQRVYQYADAVFAMSPDMKKDILSTGCPENKIKVHYYGSDVKRFYNNHEYSNSLDVKFLIISGLVPQKGHKFLLAAFYKAIKTNNNIQLTIVGAGELEQKIREQIIEFQLSKNVSLAGPVIYASNEHLKFFTDHDVFIHPSVTDLNGDKEGIPGAIVEAMAAGLPVISTFHAGIPFIIKDNESGLLVKERDVNALYQAILKLAGSSALRRKLGLAGQHYAMEELDLHFKEKELEMIYQMLGE